MFVVAAPGIKVPKEDKPHDYIEQEAVEVSDDSAYYLRRISDGDLIITEQKTETKKAKGAE
ncbi:DUF2635 domain-containing protein [Methylophilus sp. YYY-1]|uniref:DUF2635 domain-containing protein n=1 Tax=Methylophilus sp. YYY-1 TaxID=2682087 RepID=UPI0023B21CAC|nr:DUF2635 domain-containing protein [Methylophilus sp. YYY-1]MDF0377695.1 DUF2635 domain-containing protein [Methylophilus sp. YYY-1]